ncbi:MAG: pilus assembly PilX N-terminal domain-containing protein [Synergistetes bacterium]|nr:pilus assembly PilX N-terminal domain-containing protein [Synergistota bacterium]MCX8128255.1 pilus assembly PilX N-terminal domain-containing protein [Synergistota bacterium]MDW8192702.1 pilus assembly PilX N-terminal domain-containing protein [Synergistota bacterium]
MSLVILTVLAVIGGGFAFLYSSQQAVSRAEVRGSQSFFAAEAGINEAVSKYRLENPSFSLSNPKWFYGSEARSLLVSWTQPYLPDHNLFLDGLLAFRVENFKICEQGNEVYFYVEGVLKEGEKVASRFPLALKLTKTSIPQGEGIGVEASVGIGEVLIIKRGEIWKRLSDDGYRGGQALERAFTLVGGGKDYEIVLGPGVYVVPMKRAGDYCYGIDVEGNKSIILRSAKGWGPQWVKVVGIIPYKASSQITDANYWSTIRIRNGAELTIRDIWLSPPLERINLEKEVHRNKDISAVLVDDINTRLVLQNCIVKNRDLVAYMGSSLSSVKVILRSKGLSELEISNSIFDAGNFLDYKTGSTSYAVSILKVSDKDAAFNGRINSSVFLNHNTAIVNGVSNGFLIVENSLFWRNMHKTSGLVTLVNTVEEDPKFKEFYSFSAGFYKNIEWFRHWDGYIPQKDSVLESRNIGLTSYYWKRMLPVPKGGEIILVYKMGDTYRYEKFYSADSAFMALKSYYSSTSFGSALLLFGRGFWYITQGYEFNNIGSFIMISAWGPLFTPLFTFLPEVWQAVSSTKGVLSFNNASEISIYGFYFGLSGGKSDQGEKVFMKLSGVSSLDIADCIFKRIYGGMGRLIDIKIENCLAVNICNNVFDHEYRRVVADLSGVPNFYDRSFLNTSGLQYSGNINIKGNLFWGENFSGAHNDSVSSYEEENFFPDGNGKVIKALFNPLSYRLVFSGSNSYLEGNFDGGDMGLRMDLYPYIRVFYGENNISLRLENQIERISGSDLNFVLINLLEGETLILGKGSYSLSSNLSVSKIGLGILGMWGPYYTKVDIPFQISISERGFLLYGLGLEVSGIFSEKAVISLSKGDFVFKDLFLRLKSNNSSWEYGVYVSSGSGLVKNIHINGSYLEGSNWLAKGNFGLYIPAGGTVIDHVSSLRHRITGIKWAGRLYGCNSYLSGSLNYDPSNVDSSNISSNPGNNHGWVCFPHDSPCYWWNNVGNANTGSYRGIDWANLPISPR